MKNCFIPKKVGGAKNAFIKKKKLVHKLHPSSAVDGCWMDVVRGLHERKLGVKLILVL